MNAALWLAVAVLGTAPGPLHLVTEQVGESIRITVVGTSKVACHANYVLQVSTVMEGGRNRAVQRGTAWMKPGAKTEVARPSLPTREIGRRGLASIHAGWENAMRRPRDPQRYRRIPLSLSRRFWRTPLRRRTGRVRGT